MNAHSQRYLDALVHQFNTQYGQRADLAVVYGSAALGTQHAMSDVDVFYVPHDPLDHSLNQTVLINEIGYDLFGLDWDRLNRIAMLQDDLQPLILQGHIIYAKDEASRLRFEQLRETLIKNLKDPILTQEASLRLFNRAIQKAGLLLSQDEPRLVKVNALLSIQDCILAHLMRHGKTLSNGFASITKDCQAIPNFPMELLEAIDTLALATDQTEMIQIVQKSLNKTVQARSEEHIEPTKMSVDELTAFYQEAISTTHKIIVACQRQDLRLAFISSAHLQNELNGIFPHTILVPFDLLEGFKDFQWASFHTHLARCWDGFREDLSALGCDVDGFKDMTTYLNHLETQIR